MHACMHVCIRAARGEKAIATTCRDRGDLAGGEIDLHAVGQAGCWLRSFHAHTDGRGIIVHA